MAEPECRSPLELVRLRVVVGERVPGEIRIPRDENRGRGAAARERPDDPDGD
ncbi:MAG TPA: hypothetical protein VK926_10265 [Gaiellaceae bacterium]|nr:hypothetical protein [Gaiellaceae bacterium]